MLLLLHFCCSGIGRIFATLMVLLSFDRMALIEIVVVVAGFFVLVDLVQHSYSRLLLKLLLILKLVLLMSYGRCPTILKLDLLLRDCLCRSCGHLLMSVAVLIILLLLLLLMH